MRKAHRHACGYSAFDTSPSYNTESLLGNAISNFNSSSNTKRHDFYITTKIDAWQMIQSSGDIRPFVSSSLKKLRTDYIDCLLIHWPQPDYLIQTWKSFEWLYQQGIVHAIGVCNFEIWHFQKLERSGLNFAPQIVQNEIHPLNTQNKIQQYCSKNNIALQAYCPLGRMISQINQNPTLVHLAEKYEKSIAQVILNWHHSRNIIPVVKTSHAYRMQENSDAFKFDINEDDINAINNLNEDFKIFLGSRCCPGY